MKNAILDLRLNNQPTVVGCTMSINLSVLKKETSNIRKWERKLALKVILRKQQYGPILPSSPKVSKNLG